MAKEKDKFLAGAKEQKIDRKKAEAIFDLMAKFAEYGFNKSHSAAYALVAYQTAFLKAHYPVEFMAALLTEDMGNTDKVIKNIADCRDMGIELLPPDINASHLSFRVLENSIRFGLGAVKNVGEAAIEAILEARKEGPFTDIFNFCERVDLRRVNKRVVESLIKCGAFDSTKAPRATLMAGMEEAMNIGQRIQQELESAQASLFGTAETVKFNGNGGARLPEVPEWDEKLLLGFEKEALGFFITGHPLSRHAALMKRFVTANTASLTDLPDKSEVRLCGIVSTLKEILTKKGERMGFIVIEDLTGSVEVVVLPDIYATSVEFLKSDEPLLITGTLEVGEKGLKIRASDVRSLKQVHGQETRRVHLTLEATGLERDHLETLKRILGRYQGECNTLLHIVTQGESRTTIKLPEICRVTPTEDLAMEVNNLFGYNAVTFE